MKRLMVTSFVLLAGFSGGVMAVCTSPYLDANAVSNLLPGNTVCSPANCNQATCTWQEQHRGSGISGTLWDYKKGASDPVDPTKQVGNWSVASNGRITHSYTGGGGSFTYAVKDNGGGSYGFCSGAPGSPEIPFSVKSGVSAGCP